MAKPRYRYRHQQERKAWEPIVAAGEAVCMQPDPHRPGSEPGSGCVMKTRWIAPGAKWQLAHDETGTVTLGPAHTRCNARDGAIRGNKMRARKSRPKVVKRSPTANRWQL